MNNLDEYTSHLLEQNEQFKDINIEINNTRKRIQEIDNLLVEYNNLITEQNKLIKKFNSLEQKKHKIYINTYKTAELNKKAEEDKIKLDKFNELKEEYYHNIDLLYSRWNKLNNDIDELNKLWNDGDMTKNIYNIKMHDLEIEKKQIQNQYHANLHNISDKYCIHNYSTSDVENIKKLYPFHFINQNISSCSWCTYSICNNCYSIYRIECRHCSWAN